MTLPLDTGIVQVSTSDSGGGAERVAANLHHAYLRRGLDATLAVGFRFGNVERSVLIPNDAMRGAWVRSVLAFAPKPAGPMERMSAGRRTLRRLVKATAEPARALRQLRGHEDFDFPGTRVIPTLGGGTAGVVHLHNLHGGYFDLRCLPWLSQQQPTVLTAHDTWLSSGHCAYTLGCERWLSGCGDCPHLSAPPALSADGTAENLDAKRE